MPSKKIENENKNHSLNSPLYLLSLSPPLIVFLIFLLFFLLFFLGIFDCSPFIIILTKERWQDSNLEVLGGVQYPPLLDSDDASNSITQVIYMPIINEQLSDGSAKESISTQVMDRAGESPLPDTNRIPPHVFDRTKSTTQVEWSVASNESLFSLHMGNMSFTNEQLNWMNKSGELGLIGDGHFSGDIPFSPAPPLPPVIESHESSIKDDNMNQELGATEASEAETMREIIRENASDHNNQEKLPPPKAVSPRKPDPRAHSAKSSDDSSVKSFAFPILTGVGKKSGSMSINHGKKKKKQHSQPSTPKTAAEPETPGSKSEPVTPKQHTHKATNKKAWQGKWFSCFSCCPFCS